MPVRCNLLELGQGACRSTDCTSHCRCGHPKSHQYRLRSVRHSQCTLLPSTRPGTRFTYEWAEGIFLKGFVLSWDSIQCLLGYEPRLHQRALTHIHTHTDSQVQPSHENETREMLHMNLCMEFHYITIST